MQCAEDTMGGGVEEGTGSQLLMKVQEEITQSDQRFQDKPELDPSQWR